MVAAAAAAVVVVVVIVVIIIIIFISAINDDDYVGDDSADIVVLGSSDLQITRRHTYARTRSSPIRMDERQGGSRSFFSSYHIGLRLARDAHGCYATL